MGLFSKKKEVEREEIPRLPELPEPSTSPALLPKSEVPDVPPGLPEIETHELPTLPNFEHEKSDEEAIKHEIYKPQKRNFEHHEIKDFPDSTSSQLQRSLEIASHPKNTGIRTLELGSSRTQGFYKPSVKKTEPIYIRLDKFQTTIEVFEEIKGKIIEIEDLLKKTREIKTKEEQELVEWEREIQIMKSRIDSIDKNIFNKLD